MKIKEKDLIDCLLWCLEDIGNVYNFSTAYTYHVVQEFLEGSRND